MKLNLLMNKYLFVLMIILFTACKSISVQDNSYHLVKEQISLGSIGQDKNNILRNTYSNVAIPNYITPIKVQATVISFNKSSYKSFEQAQEFQTNTFHVKYVDSVELKPSFLNIEIVDQVGLIHLLNDKTNVDIKDYLIDQTESPLMPLVWATANL